MGQKDEDIVVGALQAEVNELRMKLNRSRRGFDALVVANEEISNDRSHLMAILGLLVMKNGGEMAVVAEEVENVLNSKLMVGFFTEGDKVVIRIKEGDDDESEATEPGEAQGGGAGEPDEGSGG